MHKWSAATAALIFATAASGCARGGGGAAKPLVGVTLLTEQHAFYKTLEDGLRQEANAKNLDLNIVACEMDPAKQASQIEDFVARHVAARTKAGKLVSVAGGGDTVAALNQAHVADDFTFVSTAGGAFLEWMEGRVLPGVAALEQNG